MIIPDHKPLIKLFNSNLLFIPDTLEFSLVRQSDETTLFVENTRQNSGYACQPTRKEGFSVPSSMVHRPSVSSETILYSVILDIHHFFKHILSANPKRPGYMLLWMKYKVLHKWNELDSMRLNREGIK